MDGITKSGRRMRATIYERVVRVMSDAANDGLTRIKLARLAKVSPRTLRDYLTVETLAEVDRRRGGALRPEDLAEVDRAMFLRAREGSVEAARLLYTRMAGVRDEEDVPTLEELLQELKKLEVPTG